MGGGPLLQHVPPPMDATTPPLMHQKPGASSGRPRLLFAGKPARSCGREQGQTEGRSCVRKPQRRREGGREGGGEGPP